MSKQLYLPPLNVRVTPSPSFYGKGPDIDFSFSRHLRKLNGGKGSLLDLRLKVYHKVGEVDSTLSYI